MSGLVRVSLRSFRGRNRIRTTTFLAVLLALPAPVATWADELFLPAGPAVRQVPADIGAVSAIAGAGWPAPALRRREARINVGLLDRARAAVGQGDAAAGLIVLNLFEGASYRVVGLRSAPTSAGYSLQGALEGEPLSSVTLVVNGNVIVGEARRPGAAFTIRSVGEFVEIRQIDEGALPPLAEPIRPPATLSPAPRIAPSSLKAQASTERTQIDVLVVYTSLAKFFAGGQSDIEALIDLWIAAANGYYRDSGIDLSIRLAHAEELDYVESRNSWVLDALQANGDGVMDEVHAMRDAVGADLVHAIELGGFLGGSSRHCGIAYVMTAVNSSFAAWAFASTVLGCGSTVFVHELGHNMGLRHDRYGNHTYNSSGNRPYAHAHGYVNQRAFASGAAASKRWYTVMAYGTQCSHAGISCQRIGRFSNPALTWSDDPTGVWHNGNVHALSGPADAALTLNQTKATVAGFRTVSSVPQVVSLRRWIPEHERTDTDSLTWRLAFSQDVRNLTADDFELAGAGLGATTLAVQAEHGGQRIWIINVTSGVDSFDGSVTLGFASGQNIESLSGTALDTAWPAHAQRAYTLDNTAPMASISPSSAGSSPFTATIVFDEDVTGFSDAADVTATNATVAAPSRSDARTYTVQVTPTGSVAATITLNVVAAAAMDLAGNDVAMSSGDVAWDSASASSVTVSGLSDASAVENSQWMSATPTVAGNPSGMVTWTKEGPDAALFTINPSTGVLGLPAQDFEAPADADGSGDYEVTARATDAKGNSGIAAVTITVANAVEPKTRSVCEARSRKIPEGIAYSSRPYLDSAARCATGVAVPATWTKTGADQALFVWNSAMGRLSLGARDFDSPTDANRDNVYEVTLRGADADGNFASRDIAVSVFEAPPKWLAISGVANGAVEQNTSWTSTTPSVSDAAGSVTWSKEGPDAAQFSIDSGGVLTLAAPGFQSPADANRDNVYEVWLRATDAEANSGSVPVSVTVTRDPPASDLEVGVPAASGTALPPGAAFTLSATVTNAGLGDSAATVLRYYRSADARITTADTEVGTDRVGALAASGTSAESINLAAPSTAGTYYYGACVDAVAQEFDTTNNCSAPVRVTVSQPAPPPPPPPPPPPSGGGGGGGGDGDRRPEIVRELEASRLTVGAALTLDLSEAFRSADGSGLDFEASSSDPSVATAAVDEVTLTVVGLQPGDAEVQVTAMDGGGRSSSQRFTVMVAALEAVWYLPPASDPALQGFVRVVNHSGAAGEVRVTATDDAGAVYPPLTLSLGAHAVAHFNSDDLESGNPAKGLTGGPGPGTGGWRLAFEGGALDVEALAYLRATGGFLTAMGGTAPRSDGVLRLPTFNPASNTNQVSRLRLVNPSGSEALVTVTGTDDAGRSPGSPVALSVPANAACEVDAAELESGQGLACGAPQAGLGDGAGKWRLAVSSEAPLVAMGLLSSPTGHLTNLSGTAAPDPDGVWHVPLFPSASDPERRQGFVRVANRTNRAGTVRIAAFDDSDFDYGTLALALGAGEAVQFNSNDLELGNPRKGLTGSTGAGSSAWRLELSSVDIDFAANAYIRRADGFLTAMQAAAPVMDNIHRIAAFNPGSNTRQVSVLRLVNRGSAAAAASLTGADDRGVRPGSAVVVQVPAGAAVELTAAELESGEAEAISSGALGDGVGKWRLRVESDGDLAVMSLLLSPTGHLANLSGADGTRGFGLPSLLPPPTGVSLASAGPRRVRGQWDAVPGVRYGVELLRGGVPVEGRSLARTTRSDFRWSRLEPGNYRLRVRSVDSDGLAGPWSAPSNEVAVE